VVSETPSKFFKKSSIKFWFVMILLC